MSQKIRVRRIVASFQGPGGPCEGETNADAPTIPACRNALTGTTNYQRLTQEKPDFISGPIGTAIRKIAVGFANLIPFVGPLVAVGANAADEAAWSNKTKISLLSPVPVVKRSSIAPTGSGSVTPSSFGDLFSFRPQLNPNLGGTASSIVAEPSESSNNGFGLPSWSIYAAIGVVVVLLVFGRK